jgi:ethanolamine-phosphate cytidylyltransferase
MTEKAGTAILGCGDNAAMAETVVKNWSQSEAVSPFTSVVYRLLLLLGLSVDRLPSAEATLHSVIIALIALLSYSLQSRRRKHLVKELKAARAELLYLQEKLLEEPRRKNKEIRIFMDGAFDMLHFGHMNAFRLARSLGTRLVVGVNSDLSIASCKGSPLMNDEERITMVSGCKFVDEVVPDCPYIMNKDYLEWVIEKYNIDYVVHGS